MIETPYLLFLGDAPDGLAAKVAQGIKDWRPQYALGQYRMDGCKADLKIEDMDLAAAKAAGAKTLVIGVANRGGVISQEWKKVLIAALSIITSRRPTSITSNLIQWWRRQRQRKQRRSGRRPRAGAGAAQDRRAQAQPTLPDVFLRP